MANKKPLLILVASLLTISAYAQTQALNPVVENAKANQATVPVKVFSFSEKPSEETLDIQRNNKKLAALKSQLAVAEAMAKLDAARKDVVGMRGESMQPNLNLPRVVSIGGEIGNLSATLVFAGGFTRKVKAGDELGGANVVRSITVNEVRLADGIALPLATNQSLDEAVKAAAKESGSRPVFPLTNSPNYTAELGPLPGVPATTGAQASKH